MNLIEQLWNEGRKEELLELFETMQEEMRELNRDRKNLQERVRELEKKVKHFRKLYNQSQRVEW